MKIIQNSKIKHDILNIILTFTSYFSINSISLYSSSSFCFSACSSSRIFVMRGVFSLAIAFSRIGKYLSSIAKNLSKYSSYLFKYNSFLSEGIVSRKSFNNIRFSLRYSLYSSSKFSYFQSKYAFNLTGSLMFPHQSDSAVCTLILPYLYIICLLL